MDNGPEILRFTSLFSLCKVFFFFWGIFSFMGNCCDFYIVLKTFFKVQFLSKNFDAKLHQKYYLLNKWFYWNLSFSAHYNGCKFGASLGGSKEIQSHGRLEKSMVVWRKCNFLQDNVLLLLQAPIGQDELRHDRKILITIFEVQQTA